MAKPRRNQSLQRTQTTSTQDKSLIGPGQPYISVDLAEVERLAALGIYDYHIAEGLGMSVSTYSERKHNPEFLEAYKRGRHAARQRVAERLDKLAQTWGPATLFQAKNILDYADKKEEHSVGVTVKVVIEQGIVSHSQKDIVDGEFEPVSD